MSNYTELPKDAEMNSFAQNPLNEKGLVITAEAKAKGEGAKDIPGLGGHKLVTERENLGVGLVERARGQKYRERMDFEELTEEVPKSNDKVEEAKEKVLWGKQ